MRRSIVARSPLTWAILALIITQSSSYSLDHRFLARRQSETEQENTTTPKSETATSNQASQSQSQSQSPRLYPDLPRQPNFIPAFNAPPTAVGNGYQPLIPFGLAPMPNGQRLNADQQPAPFGRMPASQARHLTPAERLASQSFADGLGRRLLSLVGINTNSSNQSPPPMAESRADDMPSNSMQNEQPDDPTTKALQNATVLQHLQKGLNSVYGNLSKMYNSTVQEQLAMLQERFKSETANSTNPWHQRMAERVPMFFKQMASRVGEAQEQLNRAWHEVSTANATGPIAPTGGQVPPPAVMRARNSIFGRFDPFASAGDYEFMNQFNFNTEQQQQQQNMSSPQAMAARVQQLWATQVQPRISYVRNQIMSAWRDLPRVTPDVMMGSSSRQSSAQGSANSSSADLVDSILKEVDIGPTSEYSLVEPKSDGDAGGEASEEKPTTTTTANKSDTPSLKLSPEMQARLYQVQRDLNQVWQGLATSLQGAIANVQRSLNPRPQFAGPQFDPMVRQGSQSGKQAEDNPAMNEIDDKIKSLSKVQRDADMVNEALLQQQRETQQRQTFGDRFRGFFNNVDMNQLPDRIGEQFNRFGNAVGNFWNQLPNRWDDFVTQVRPPSQDRMRPASSTTSTSTSTAAPASERK